MAAVLGAAGVEFNLPNVKVSIPVEVGMDKFRIALIAAAMFDQFDEAIKASAEKRLSVAWEYSTTVFRNGVIVNCLARSLSLTDAQLDQLFSTAAAIQF